MFLELFLFEHSGHLGNVDFLYTNQQRLGIRSRRIQGVTPILYLLHPKDHWTLKTGYFEDPTPAIQVQTLQLEGPRSLG